VFFDLISELSQTTDFRSLLCNLLLLLQEKIRCLRVCCFSKFSFIYISYAYIFTNSSGGVS